MDELLKARLKIINDSMQSLMNSGQEVLNKLKNNESTTEDAHMIVCKLKSKNERFTTEIFNYFKLIANPSEDETKQYTLNQMQADDLIAELEARILTSKQVESYSTRNLPSDEITLPNDNVPIPSVPAFDKPVDTAPVPEPEPVASSSSSKSIIRPTRASAQRARDKVRQWTSQLLNLIE
ncbi:hypothetical protein ACJJTC_017049 [Scirpophaga incertulas]